MPKVMVSGRGGSGKSTLVALLAKELRRESQVLVLDADESNLGLNVMLGIERPKQSLLDSIGGKSAVMNKMRVLFQSDFTEKVNLFEENLTIERLTPEAISRDDSLTFMQVGKIQHSMEGCACPMGVVARDFLNHLELDEGQWALVDTDAGVEHFGRGILEGANLILIVADPSWEAVLMAKKAASLSKEADKPFWVVLNKVDAESDSLLRELLAQEGLEALAALPYSSRVVQYNLVGSPLPTDDMRMELKRIIDTLKDWVSGSA